MKRFLHWTDLLMVGIVFLGAFAVNRAPERFFSGPTHPGMRLLYDVHDKNAYIRAGRYVRIDGGAPYRDTFSEYPQLATYLFSAPFVFADNRKEYHQHFTWLMAVCLAATCLLASRVCAMLGLSPRRALLLLLPGMLYFSLNRYDIVPALVTVAAVWALLKEEIPLSFGLLAAGVLLKFYPALYVPFVAVFVYHKHGWKTLARGLAAFGLVLAVLTLQLVWWVGWSNALVPYRSQGGRPFNTESLFYLLSVPVPAVNSQVGRLLFYAAQLAPVLALPWLKLRRVEDVLRWMTVVTLTFIVFMRIQSPQWILWITPLAVLACRTKKELALLAVLDVLMYLYFPVMYDSLGIENPWFVPFLLLLVALRLVLIALLARQRQGEVVPRLGVTGVHS